MDRYSKACEVWLLLHKAEQLVINDKDYHPNVMQNLMNCMDIVETLQNKLEVSNDWASLFTLISSPSSWLSQNPTK